MRGTPAAFAALVQKDIDTLYFIAEPNALEGALYLGNKLLAGNGAGGSAGDLSELLSLNDLSDVIVNSLDLADASFLIYDKSQQAWVNCDKEALVFIGSSSLSNGKAGLVPAPKKGEEHKFLRADGTWAEVSSDNTTSKTTVYQVIAAEGETKDAAIVRIVNGAELHNGDIVIVKVLIANNEYEHTAYVYDGSHWIAMDGNYSAENVYFKNNFIFTENIGTVKVPESGSVEVEAAGMNIKEFFNKLFSEVKNPVITDVSLAVNLINTDFYYEVGTEVTPEYTSIFNPGSYEFGPETDVAVLNYSAIDSNNKINNSAFGFMPSFIVNDDTKYNIILSADYSDGVKALNNLQQESDLYISNGTISASTNFIRGYRPTFIGVDNNTGAITSDIIRNLSNSVHYNHGMDITISAKNINNPTRFIIAIPSNSNRDGIVEIIMPESMNYNCTNDYVQLDNVLVQGANNSEAIEYEVWVYAPSKIGMNEVHRITLN